MQAMLLDGMPVLLSFEKCNHPFYDKGFQQTFSRLLVDSGAYSEMTSGKPVDIAEYKDWSQQWKGHADAIAGLDNIKGDWKQSLKNYEFIPWGFPTIHNTDPPELLKDLIPMALERGGWLGLGLTLPRANKDIFVQRVCDSIPKEIHLHGWALGAYAHIARFDSVDSTGWVSEAMGLRTNPLLAHLNFPECIQIVVKRYQRRKRVLRRRLATLF